MQKGKFESTQIFSFFSICVNGGQWVINGGCQWGRFFLTTLGIHLECGFKVVKKNRPH